jgi:hypothetical protein
MLSVGFVRALPESEMSASKEPKIDASSRATCGAVCQNKVVREAWVPRGSIREFFEHSGVSGLLDTLH